MSSFQTNKHNSTKLEKIFILLTAAVLYIAVACTDSAADKIDSSENQPATEPSAKVSEEFTDPQTILALADTGDCRNPAAEIADQVQQEDGTIIIAGDLAYPNGSTEDFANCFLPLYGQELDRIYTVPGDNEYKTENAAPYWETLKNAGTKNKGWHTFQAGAWQIIALNSECSQIGGCDEQSEQYKWLQKTLNDSPDQCRLVFFHKPRFTSSANYQGIPGLQPLYQLLYDAGTDIIVAGNSHHYERFAPLDPNGEIDEEQGIRNFTIGIGGAAFTKFGEPLTGSEVRDNQSRGYMKFTLAETRYQWEFINVGNKGLLQDSGQSSCTTSKE